MPNFADYTLRQMAGLRERLEASIRECTAMQPAAQKFVESLCEEFGPSLVLARLFGTAPFGKLPPADQDFVRRSAAARGVLEELGENSSVISLLGTRGVLPAWNDRHLSRERLGIPLVSASFVKTIPMVSRLMSDLGTGLPWVDKQRTNILVKSAGQMARLLHVEDAGVSVSGDGFKIVPAQDFVRTHRVRSVLGLGGSYLNQTFIALILFTRELVSLQQSQKFLTLINSFKIATMEHVMNGKLFD